MHRAALLLLVALALGSSACQRVATSPTDPPVEGRGKKGLGGLPTSLSTERLSRYDPARP